MKKKIYRMTIREINSSGEYIHDTLFLAKNKEEAQKIAELYTSSWYFYGENVYGYWTNYEVSWILDGVDEINKIEILDNLKNMSEREGEDPEYMFSKTRYAKLVLED